MKQADVEREWREEQARCEAHWESWFDRSCVCGFPHPKPGHYGPPPTVVEGPDGEPIFYPEYPGVMGGDDPVPSASSEKGHA